MKIQIVFNPVARPGREQPHDLILCQITDLETGLPIEGGTIGEWAADGEYEALNLDVLPPLDKVTLTVVEPSGKPLYHIKPLAWIQYPSGFYWVARGAGQQYQILRLDNGDYKLTGTKVVPWNVAPTYKTLELAQAAAWDYYVAHMIAFLE